MYENAEKIKKEFEKIYAKNVKTKEVYIKIFEIIKKNIFNIPGIYGICLVGSLSRDDIYVADLDILLCVSNITVSFLDIVIENIKNVFLLELGIQF